jgi:HSP20 family protein
VGKIAHRPVFNLHPHRRGNHISKNIVAASLLLAKFSKEESYMAEVSVTRGERREPTLFGFGFEPLFQGSLFGVNPFALMRRFTEEMDRMFAETRGGTTGTMAEWRPAIEVKELPGELQVCAEIPGVKPEDVKVHVDNNILTVEGERKAEKEEKREGFYHSERSYGKFSRSIALPEGAYVDKAKAQFNNGVLEITVPMPEKKQARKEIPVSSVPAGKQAA